jgi:hypothetical protein
MDLNPGRGILLDIPEGYQVGGIIGFVYLAYAVHSLRSGLGRQAHGFGGHKWGKKHCHKGICTSRLDHARPSSYRHETVYSDPSPDAHDHFGPLPVPCLNYPSAQPHPNHRRTHKHPSMIRNPITSPTDQPPVRFRHCPNMIFDYRFHHSNKDLIFGWGPSLSLALPCSI